jgi:hypothetical protein
LPEKIHIAYKENSIKITIPVIITIDTGAGKKENKYKVNLPFQIYENSIVPAISNIEEIQKIGKPLTATDIIQQEMRFEKARHIQILLGMNYKMKQIMELDEYLKINPVSWFREYKKLVYHWMLKNIKKIKTQELQNEIKDKIIQDLAEMNKNLDIFELSDKYNEIRNLFINTKKSGVQYNNKENKYIFKEAIAKVLSVQRIKEFINKINNLE